MQLKKMLADVSYEVLQGTLNRDVVDIAYDSRKVVRDGMFVATMTQAPASTAFPI